MLESIFVGKIERIDKRTTSATRNEQMELSDVVTTLENPMLLPAVKSQLDKLENELSRLRALIKETPDP